MGKLRIEYETDSALMTRAGALSGTADEAEARLYGGELDFTGWVNYAARFPEAELSRIEKTAAEIAEKCDAFVVIGIGGSYLGARAALSFIDREDSKKTGVWPKAFFAGFNLSGTYHQRLLQKLRDRDLCVIVISKSGGTLEPSAAFAVFKDLLIEKYGREEAYGRIYAITDAKSGKLKAEADKNGYASFVLPSDIGGRYSVLSPVGLLPIAAAGIDIRRMLSGAAGAEAPELRAIAKELACVRAALEQEKTVETIASYDPSVEDFAGWAQQLFGESEGKDGRGALPVSVSFSRDLHSLGQFFQDGRQIFYETMLFVENPTFDITIQSEDAPDVKGRSYSEFNRAVLEGVTRAHRAAQIPVIRVLIPENSAEAFGQLVYVFELCCAVTGLLMGVNPFDQPGVEAYKKGMLDYLENSRK